MPAAADTQLLSGRYHLDTVVGEGGMAVVWRATDTLLGRTVAVKVLRSQYSSDPAFLSRFQSEARAAAALNDPGIVAVYDVGSDDGRHYLVLELVPGEDMKTVIRREAPLAPERVVRYGAALARAVAAAHKVGLVHRDLKPQNVLLTPDGRLKVADFGIARATADAGVTAPGIVMGTAHYVSPEQAAGGSATPASDVYALGVVLYEMLTGHVPFDADTAMGVAMRIMHEDAPSVTALNPLVPERLAAIVRRAMARQADERYADAGALAHVLEAYLKWSQQDTDIGMPAGRSAAEAKPAARPAAKPASVPPAGRTAASASESPAGLAAAQDPPGPAVPGPMTTTATASTATAVTPPSESPLSAAPRAPGSAADAAPSMPSPATKPPAAAKPAPTSAAAASAPRSDQPSWTPAAPHDAPTEPLFDWTGLVLALVAAAALAGLIPLWYQVYLRGGANGPAAPAGAAGTGAWPGAAPTATPAAGAGAPNEGGGTSGDASSGRPFLGAGVAPLVGAGAGADSAAPVTVPNLRGQTEAAAIAALRALGLASTTEATDGTPAADLSPGQVTDQHPRPGEAVPAGTVVNLVVVARQLTQVEIPNVIGQTYDNAAAAVQARGLVPEYRQVWSGRGAGGENGIVAVNPPPGSQAVAGDRVILTVNSGPYLSLGVTFGDGLYLAGASLDENHVDPGGSLVLEPSWEAVAKVEGDYSAVALLVDAAGAEVARAAASPLTADGPSSALAAGAKARGRPLELAVPAGAAPGQYSLWLMLHRDGADADVLTVRSGGFARVSGNRAHVMDIRVGR